MSANVWLAHAHWYEIEQDRAWQCPWTWLDVSYTWLLVVETTTNICWTDYAHQWTMHCGRGTCYICHCMQSTNAQHTYIHAYIHKQRLVLYIATFSTIESIHCMHAVCVSLRKATHVPQLPSTHSYPLQKQDCSSYPRTTSWYVALYMPQRLGEHPRCSLELHRRIRERGSQTPGPDSPPVGLHSHC